MNKAPRARHALRPTAPKRPAGVPPLDSAIVRTQAAAQDTPAYSAAGLGGYPGRAPESTPAATHHFAAAARTTKPGPAVAGSSSPSHREIHNITDGPLSPPVTSTPPPPTLLPPQPPSAINSSTAADTAEFAVSTRNTQPNVPTDAHGSAARAAAGAAEDRPVEVTTRRVRRGGLTALVGRSGPSPAPPLLPPHNRSNATPAARGPLEA